MSTSVQEILEAARDLSTRDRVLVAGALLRHVSEEIIQVGGLPVLRDLTEPELQALADASLAPERQQHLQVLLDKNRKGALSSEEEAALEELLAESDRLALLKAKAYYTLYQRSNGRS